MVVEGEVFESVVDGWVVIMPHAFLRSFGVPFGSKELVASVRLFSGEGVHAREAFLEEYFGEVLAVDVHGADEAADFVHGFDFDFDIALVAAAVGEVVGFLAEWFGFLVRVASRAWRADAGEDEGDFSIFSVYEDCEAGAAFNEVNDGGYTLFVLEGSEYWGGFLDRHGVVLVIFGYWRFC